MAARGRLVATVVVVALGLLDAEMPEPRVRVFGVGFKKTGTTSLSNACTLLSLREVGLEAKAKLLQLESRALRGDAEPFFDIIDRFECFQDAPFTNPHLAPLLFERYPDAKFVLTTRNASSWFVSAKRWIDRKERENPKYGTAFWEALGWRSGAPPSLAAAAALLERHDAAVRSALGPRLLEIDFAREIDAPAFWTRLCGFVGLPQPCPCPPVPRSNTLAGRDELGQPV